MISRVQPGDVTLDLAVKALLPYESDAAANARSQQSTVDENDFTSNDSGSFSGELGLCYHRRKSERFTAGVRSTYR